MSKGQGRQGQEEKPSSKAQSKAHAEQDAEAAPHWWLAAQTPDLEGLERRRRRIESYIGRKLEDHECRPVWWPHRKSTDKG
ncbi:MULTISPECIES: hypothetical protein [unclassified Salipiger]|uniref:hypothetical protein n=1 Tax=unclassified Salipiger TaxID=2640570 RepID=UPI0013BDCC65|nr:MULTISPECIES: hypothetical protein [unclassified Salipiger]NDV52563.1 hypothetical protein [Salipiger sp. PrR003]NDW32732.1 hypothetical protein [Salipiger sp. PrR007]